MLHFNLVPSAQSSSCLNRAQAALANYCHQVKPLTLQEPSALSPLRERFLPAYQEFVAKCCHYGGRYFGANETQLGCSVGHGTPQVKVGATFGAAPALDLGLDPEGLPAVPSSHPSGSDPSTTGDPAAGGAPSYSPEHSSPAATFVGHVVNVLNEAFDSRKACWLAMPSIFLSPLEVWFLVRC